MIDFYKKYWMQMIAGTIEDCEEQEILDENDISEIADEFINDDEIWGRIDACIWFYVNAKVYDKKQNNLK